MQLGYGQVPIDKLFLIRTWKSTDENLLLSPINISHYYF